MSVLACPLPFTADECIVLGHGSGGRLCALDGRCISACVSQSGAGTQ